MKCAAVNIHCAGGTVIRKHTLAQQHSMARQGPNAAHAVFVALGKIRVLKSHLIQLTGPVVSLGMSFSEGVDGTNSQNRFPNPSASLLAMGKALQSKSSALSLALGG